MKPTLDTRVQDALETAQNLENITSGSASRLACALRHQLDDIADEVGRITREYATQVKRGGEWQTFSNDETHSEEWWPDMSGAEEDMYRVDIAHETRIVRRCVSPPEVINE